ncbi:MAG TPA: hypothetical protein VIL18_00295 [Longimicrobiales bacterium]
MTLKACARSGYSMAHGLCVQSPDLVFVGGIRRQKKPIAEPKALLPQRANDPRTQSFPFQCRVASAEISRDSEGPP